MIERTLRPSNIAAAALVIGGAVAVVLPQHAMSVVPLVIATIAAAAALYALAVNAPPIWWKSPFEPGASRSGDGSASDPMFWIRSALSGRRQRLEGGAALPAGALRLLQPLIRSALEREGLDPRDSAFLAAARDRLSPLTFAVLVSQPLERPHRFRTLRPDRREAAELVHNVLDELDRLGTGAPTANHTHGVPLK